MKRNQSGSFKEREEEFLANFVPGGVRASLVSPGDGHVSERDGGLA